MADASGPTTVSVWMFERRITRVLIDGDIETVVGSIKSDDYKAAATFLMMMHRHGYKYLYRAMDIETGEIVMSTTKNEFQ